MSKLSVLRKLILCVGLLVSAVLFLYPNWRVSFQVADHKFDYGIGRSFISSSPDIKPDELAELAGLKENLGDSTGLGIVKAIVVTYRIHYIRQITEVVLSLLFTFGLLWAAGGWKELPAPAT